MGDGEIRAALAAQDDGAALVGADEVEGVLNIEPDGSDG
jgi:hypothetical protein